jgi:predicted GNAT family acetyltransferase
MATEVIEDEAQERYELFVDGTRAGRLEYRGHGPMRALTHTEVDPAYEGQGLGSQLIRAVLDDQRANGRHILPMCPFVRAYLDRHPEDVELVEPKQRPAFNLG